MAAWDTFENATRSLTEHEQRGLAPLIARTRSDLLAARSEEARVRIVHDFLREAHTVLTPGKHP
jgi:hypothetical protein